MEILWDLWDFWVVKGDLGDFIGFQIHVGDIR